MFLQTSQNSQENIYARVLFFRHRCFLVNFAKFLKTAASVLTLVLFTVPPRPFVFSKQFTHIFGQSTLSGKKNRGKFLLGKNFVWEKFSHFWKISHFSPTNFSNSSLFPDQFLKLKGLSWVGLLFFPRKVVLLVWDFSNWARKIALLVSLNLFFDWFLKLYNF